MQTGFLHLHNFMRWLVLIFALLTLITAAGGMNGKKTFSAGNKRIALFFLISCDIQLVLGLALYFMYGWWNVLTSGAAMASKYNRFFSVEHLFGMLVALVLIHIGYSSTKKNIPDVSKFKRLFWFTFIAVILILATIPWPGREMIGRPLFPGMAVAA